MTTRRDSRDGVIEALADSEHGLAAESGQLRDALHVATEMLRERDGELAELRGRHYQLLDEHRALLAQTPGVRKAA